MVCRCGTGLCEKEGRGLNLPIWQKCPKRGKPEEKSDSEMDPRDIFYPPRKKRRAGCSAEGRGKGKKGGVQRERPEGASFSLAETREKGEISYQSKRGPLRREESEDMNGLGKRRHPGF